MAIKLTDQIVRSLVPPATGNRIQYDTEVSGFGARITAAGVVSFIMNYRNRDGVSRRYTIGRYPAWSVMAARERAKELRREIDAGGDPVTAKKALRDAPTIRDLIERFREEHVSRKQPATVLSYGWSLKEIERELGSLKVASVTFAECDGLHRKISKRGKLFQANRTHAVLSKMFNLAIKWQMRLDNPCRGVERNHEEPRERYLTPEEIVRLTAVLADYHVRSSADLFMLLLLTGARVGETLAARWQDINLTAGTWSKPSHHTKTKKTHHVPLSAPARERLEQIRNRQNGSETEVFPDRKRRQTLMKDWADICRQAHLKDVHIHDLRHAHASLLASAGFSLPVIGKMLGHVQAATTQRYSHLLNDVLKEAADAVGDVVSGKAKLTVVKGGRS
jgi:integrase